MLGCMCASILYWNVCMCYQAQTLQLYGSIDLHILEQASYSKIHTAEVI